MRRNTCKHVSKCNTIEDIPTLKCHLLDQDLHEETLMLLKHAIKRGNCENIN